MINEIVHNISESLIISFKLIGKQFNEIVNRNDYISTIENSYKIENVEDKIKISNAIDDLIINNLDEKDVTLSNGEVLKIQM